MHVKAGGRTASKVTHMGGRGTEQTSKPCLSYSPEVGWPGGAGPQTGWLSVAEHEAEEVARGRLLLWRHLRLH
jgi:hypothetical protein